MGDFANFASGLSLVINIICVCSLVLMCSCILRLSLNNHHREAYDTGADNIFELQLMEQIKSNDPKDGWKEEKDIDPSLDQQNRT